MDIKVLKKLSKDRIRDSEILFIHRRYDASAYLCGYAVELALKYRMCKCLKWTTFPETNSEFGELKFLKTHNYETLLRLTGKTDVIKIGLMAEWSVLAKWSPENRYRPSGTIKRTDSIDMIDSTKKIVETLCGK